MRKSLLGAALFFSFFIAHAASAETVVSGWLTEDTTWTLSGSPYVVTSDLAVPAGVTLVIEPGVVVKPTQYAGIDVVGTIIAEGTEIAPITFTSFHDDTVGGDTNGNGSGTGPAARDWKHIEIFEGGTGIFRHTTVRYGGVFDDPQPMTGIKNDGGEVILDHSTLTDNGYDGFNQTSGTSVISHSRFARHEVGVMITGGTSEITDSIVEENSIGLAVYRWTGASVVTVASSTFTNNLYGIEFSDTEFSMHNSRIVGNTYVGLNGYSENAISAEYNWWGDASGPLHENNPGGMGDRIEGNVLFTPWLTTDPSPESVMTTATSTLSFATATPNGLWEDDGIQDAKGAASSTTFTFSAIYTNSGNIAPDAATVEIYLASLGLDDFASLPLALDLTATTTLRDGDYRNGEQYAATSTFPKNEYKYFFEANVGSTTISMPTSTALSFQTGYSNVMFLPGLQASRLYGVTDSDCTFNCENQLWEPNRKDDVKKLFLDQNGKSTTTFDVYTRDVIDAGFGVAPDIYDTFIEMMDELKDTGEIVDWKPTPYDWRLSVDDILDNGVLLPDGNITYNQVSSAPYIAQTLTQLATTSSTHKVTIIAHSNGGLVAKRLMERLQAEGKASMVDKVILLGSPQLGTPKAIAAILHGEGQELGFGHLLDKPIARGLAINMPGAYQLLPSSKYFSLVDEAPVIFRENTSTQAMFDTYGTSTNSAAELNQFLQGTEGRGAAFVDDWETPTVLKSTLLTNAQNLHSSIDSWTPPSGVELIQIGGWGLDTIKSVRYTERYDVTCACNRITYIPTFADEGDETVVIPSALATASSTRYWVDLFDANRRYKKGWKHSSITEVLPIQELLKTILGNKDFLTPITTVATSTPAVVLKKLRYTLHSPLSLGLFNSEGRYTGLASSSVPDVEFPRVIEEIPNSYYMEFGETKILGAPDEGTSTIRMVGESLGVFTLDIEYIKGGHTVSSTTFPDIPVATGTIVTLDQGIVGTSTLKIDIDGNGSVDVTVGQEGFDDLDTIILLRHLVRELNLGEKQEKKLIKIIDRFENVLKKEFKKEEKRISRLSRILLNFESRVDTFSVRGKITLDDALELKKLIELVRLEVLQ